MVNSIKYRLGDEQEKHYKVLIEVNMEVSDESDKGVLLKFIACTWWVMKWEGDETTKRSRKRGSSEEGRCWKADGKEPVERGSLKISDRARYLRSHNVGHLFL